MATLYDIKPRFQATLRPYADTLVTRGYSANQVTLAALVLSAAEGALLLWMPGEMLPLLLLPVVLFVRMALNAIDGMLAREHGQASPLGALLNEVCDLASDAALYLPLALVPGLDARLVVAAAAIGLIAEGAGLAAVQIGARRGYDGPLGKSDRALGFGALGLLCAFGGAATSLASFLSWALLLLGVVTVGNRMRVALEQRGPR